MNITMKIMVAGTPAGTMRLPLYMQLGRCLILIGYNAGPEARSFFYYFTK